MEIEQVRFLKRRREIRLNEDDSISVSIHEGWTVNEFSVSLALLADNPSRIRSSGGKYVIGLVLFLFFSFCSFLEAIIAGDKSARTTSLASGVLLLIPALVFALQVWRGRYDLLVFFNRYSGKPIFNLFYNQPDPNSFARFRSELILRIQRCHAQNSSAEKVFSIPEQLERFARLQERGILSAEEFARIKLGLIANADAEARKIGF